MKRNVSFLAIFAMVLVAFSCGAKSKKAEQKEDAKIVQLNTADFLTKIANYKESPLEWKYLGDKPSIVTFGADWCPACKKLKPVLEELAAEYDGSIYVYEVDVDDEPEVSGAFGIEALPTTLIIPMDGAPILVKGAVPKDVLKKAIDEELLGVVIQDSMVVK